MWADGCNHRVMTCETGSESYHVCFCLLGIIEKIDWPIVKKI